MSKMPRISKTIKLFIGGQFPRTESGRSFAVNYHDSDKIYANLCQGSRKDFRNAVEVAEKAQKGWASRSAYNRSQILYRMAEMCEWKRVEFSEVFKDTLGWDKATSDKEIDAAIDAFVFYAGFCDKYQQVTGALNPVAQPQHCFTFPDPVGVVALICEDKFQFGKLVSDICSVLVGGNSVVALLGKECPAVIAPLAEVFATSDLPGGVVNLLTGDLEELHSHIATHMEVRSISFQHEDKEMFHTMKAMSVDNMKRMIGRRSNLDPDLKSITQFVEFKTTWHPVGI